jgi:hypothetical protein
MTMSLPAFLLRHDERRMARDGGGGEAPATVPSDEWPRQDTRLPPPGHHGST